VQTEATTSAPLQTSADTVVIGVVEGEGIPHDLPGGELSAMLSSGEASAAPRRLAVTHYEQRRFILVGLGPRPQLDAERMRVAAATAHGRARELGTVTLCWEVPHHVDDAVVAAIVEGSALHDYRFDRYRQRDERRAIERLLLSAHHDVSEVVERATVTVTAQNRARDLANTPANDLPPAALGDYASELAARFDSVDATILDESAIRAAGMGAFAAVAQGSSQDARLIRLDYAGPAAASAPLLGFIGKAVTFDSGGLSLKPPATMHEMKFDMAGGAAVIEAVAALAELGAPVRVLALVGATENLPGPASVKPGDIVRALDGTTIEVDNTDAEGRLVLADCLTYARREGAQRLVDVATLTGAIVVALGSTYAGLFANDDAWAAEVQNAASRAGEPVWRMPLHPDYAHLVKGQYAQLTNRPDRREAMSITAAEFLHHFAGDTPWAHLDIVGTAWNVRRRYFSGKGATGYGVRLLVEVALSRS
jgi:leucyl aminopeptidase